MLVINSRVLASVFLVIPMLLLSLGTHANQFSKNKGGDFVSRQPVPTPGTAQAASTPANDDCLGATKIAVNFGVVGPTQNVVYSEATPSGLPTCTGIADDDVWFKSILYGPGPLVVSVGGLSGYDPVVQIYTGTCNNLVQRACLNKTGTGKMEDTLLLMDAGIDTLYVRVYHAGVGSGSGKFAIGASWTPPPINDRCPFYYVLQFNGPGLGSHTYGATQSLPPSPCSGVTADTVMDIWYKFTPDTANAQLQVGGYGMFDPVVEAFSGNCDTLVSLACVNDSGAGHYERLTLDSLTPGQSYYVRIYSPPPNTSTIVWMYAGKNPCTVKLKSLDRLADTVACMGSSITLSPGGGFYSYQWSDNSADSSLAVTIPGDYWVQLMDYKGCLYRDSIHVAFEICSEIQPTLMQGENVHLFPNPNGGQFNLAIGDAEMVSGRVTICNSKGIEVWKESFQKAGGVESFPIQVNGLLRGIYWVEVETDKWVRHKRLVIE